MDSCAAASPVPEVEMSPIYRVNNFYNLYLTQCENHDVVFT